MPDAESGPSKKQRIMMQQQIKRMNTQQSTKHYDHSADGNATLFPLIPRLL
jgi:hypothetical protein